MHVVAKRLGHKDPSVTLNVYADAIPDDDDRAVTTFGKAVCGGLTGLPALPRAGCPLTGWNGMIRMQASRAWEKPF